tara:strand:- start:1275 stop:1427 length:153 start_codon:yes stop_codon:yes gene_type:complete
MELKKVFLFADTSFTSFFFIFTSIYKTDTNNQDLETIYVCLIVYNFNLTK